jgi:hypothetical protein
MDEDDDPLLLEEVIAEKPPALGEDDRLEVRSTNSTEATLAAAGSTRRKATTPSTCREARAAHPRAAREPYEP